MPGKGTGGCAGCSTTTRSPLHEQDLAKLVSAHFSDVLQQIADRDENVGAAENDDDGSEEAV